VSDDFTIKIEMGNDAMQSPEDVADVLTTQVVPLLEQGFTNGRVHDANGNTVGTWSCPNLRIG
jgi:hypothetical protein